MLSTELLRLGVEMLGWSHAQLVEFVRTRSGPGGPVSLTGPLPEPLDVELVAERTAAGTLAAHVLGVPAIAPAPAGNAEGKALCEFVARRAASFEALLAIATAPRPAPITGTDLAIELGLHLAVVERIVRNRRARVDGAVVPLESLVDLEGPVVTARRSPVLTQLLAPCADPHGLGDPSRCEWPNNVLSTRTVVYENGAVAREGDAVTVRYLPREMSRCERLAAAAEDLVYDLPIGMRSESDDGFRGYFRLAPPGGATPSREIDEAFVRELFGGTLSPWDPVVVEPFDESCSLFRDLAEGGADAATVERWRALLQFFRETPDLVPPTVLVSIGFYEYAPAQPIPAHQRPEGFASRGSCLPRMILARTDTGSVVALFGHVAWT